LHHHILFSIAILYSLIFVFLKNYFHIPQLSHKRACNNSSLCGRLKKAWNNSYEFVFSECYYKCVQLDIKYIYSWILSLLMT
jgi:hypothetical protein